MTTRAGQDEVSPQGRCLVKIALVGNFRSPHCSEHHHARSLESLGHQMVRIQEGCAITPRMISEHLPGTALLVWIKTHGWETPGLADLLAHVRSLNVPVVTYHLDLYYGIPERFAQYQVSPYMNDLDHFFTADGPLAEWLNESTRVKGHYLPPGVVHDEVFWDPQQVLNDVIFVGSYGYHPEHPYRPQLIDWLTDTYGDRFTLYGGNRPGEVAHVVRGLPLNRLYASTKVVVGDSFSPGFNYGPYFSDRCMETTGRGGMLIHPEVKGLSDCFVENEEMVFYTFGDFAGLKEKIDYYLDHDKKREQIRRAGFERTKRDHTYVVRWEHILKTVFGE